MTPLIKQGSTLRIRHLAVATIIVLSLARIVGFIGHDPLLAYANNFDMVRIQACDQMWPAQEPPKAGEQSPEAPIEYYVVEPGRAELHLCYPYSERVFTALLGVVLEEREIFSIRMLAALKAVVSLAAAALVLVALYRVSPALSAGAAIISAMLLTDPFNTLYLPTFYTEWSAFLGFLLSTLLLLLAIARPNSALYSAGLAGALIFWGLAKMQHAIMPVLALACLVPVIMRFGVRAFLFPLLGVLSATLIVIAVQVSWMKQDRNLAIHHANATNTFLFTVLGSSSTPHKLAAQLGLPSECGDHTDKSWYTPGFDPKTHCPEVVNASRLRLIALPFLDPGAFFNMLLRSGTYMRPVFPELVGQVAGQNMGRASDYVWSAYRWMDLIPLWLFGVVTIVVCISGAVYGLWQLFRHSNMDRGNVAVPGVVFFLSCMVPTIYFVALFGDGYADFAKHIHIAFSGFIALCVILISLLIARTLELARRRSRG